MNNREPHILFLNVSGPIMQHFPEMSYKARRLDRAFTSNGLVEESIASMQPDIIFLDIEYENQDIAWQRIQRLKTHRATASIPMLLCVGRQQRLPWPESFLNSQGIRLIARPFTRDEFLKTISQMVLVKC